MDLDNKVPKFWIDQNNNIIPFSVAARSATLRMLLKQLNKDEPLSSSKYDSVSFDLFKFDDDEKPSNYYIGGTPYLNWWPYRYKWSISDFNNTLWSSTEICSKVISYLIDRSLNLKNDIIAMDKMKIKFVNKTWFSILNDTTYFPIIFQPIPKLLRPSLMKRKEKKDIYHIFKEYVKLHYYYRMFII